MKYRKTYY